MMDAIRFLDAPSGLTPRGVWASRFLDTSWDWRLWNACAMLGWIGADVECGLTWDWPMR
jgi:hypothetical protein